ncbi:MAG: formate dehydrogenase accessory sulfurtransferase FdhD [Gammaproteobacteria bacterium]
MVAGTKNITIDRVSLQGRSDESDVLAVEEPLELRLTFERPEGRQTQSLSVTMRTPGEDRSLAIGFLFTEGVVRSLDEILEIEHDDDVTEMSQLTNLAKVILADEVTPDFELVRGYPYRTASGGFCGKTSLEAAASKAQFSDCISEMQVRPQALYPLPIRLAENEGAFSSTGGINAAALFDGEGKIISVHEDVRKNNALDKLIGSALLAGELPLTNSGILVSGRASFELVQKAVFAGCPILVSVGAPSSLAVALARRMGITLVGFLREGRFNIYAGPGRIL